MSTGVDEQQLALTRVDELHRLSEEASARGTRDTPSVSGGPGMPTTQPKPLSQPRSDADAPSVPPAAGIMRVLVASLCRPRSVCTCGWSGWQRVLRSLSVLDALIHAGSIGCHPAVPLADVDIGQPP